MAARLLKMTTDLAIELRNEVVALELGIVSTGPGFTPRTQASVEPAEGSQAPWFAVLERRAMSAPVSRLPASSLSTPVNSLHGNMKCPNDANSH